MVSGHTLTEVGNAIIASISELTDTLEEIKDSLAVIAGMLTEAVQNGWNQNERGSD